MNYQDWHIPIDKNEISLAQARKNLATVSADQYDIPLMVQLVENPKYKLPGITLFHGAVDLETHDCIHILLGRGLLPMDEAFTIGFTMGSTNRVSTTEEQIFTFISKNLYPDIYKFTDQEVNVFKNAIRLAFISNCKPLDTLNFDSFLDTPLKEIRENIGLEINLIKAYYEIEKQRYPDSAASQRLL